MAPWKDSNNGYNKKREALKSIDLESVQSKLIRVHSHR